MIITGGTIGHTLVFLVFYRSKHLKITENVYHLNLSIFDMIACCVVWPIVLLGQVVSILSGGLLAFTTGLVNLVTMGNVLTLSFIAQTRKSQIYHPVTKANVQGYFPRLITIWILSITAGVIGMFTPNGCYNTDGCDKESKFEIFPKWLPYFPLAVMLICLTHTCYCYVRILQKVRANRRNMEMKYKDTKRGDFVVSRRIEPLSNVTGRSSSYIMPQSRVSAWPGYDHLLKQEARIAMNSIIVLLIFLLSYVPITILGVIAVSVKEVTVPNSAMLLTVAFTGLSHCLNPYIYTLRSHKFRQGLNSLFPSLRKCWRRQFFPQNDGHTPGIEMQVMDTRESDITGVMADGVQTIENFQLSDQEVSGACSSLNDDSRPMDVSDIFIIS